jgi:hypothetical protein
MNCFPPSGQDSEISRNGNALMPSAPKHTRRWVQFSVGRLLLVVTVIAFVAAWIVVQANVVWERKALLVRLMEHDSYFITRVHQRNVRIRSGNGSLHISPVRRFFGDYEHQTFSVGTDVPDAEVQALMVLFPESTIYRIEDISDVLANPLDEAIVE